MRKIKCFEISAFTKNNKGGNLAGVVLFEETLTADQMQHIASILGFSETAFVLPSSEDEFRVRFFTPKGEVDLCGHATIAAFYCLQQKGFVVRDRYKLETKAGKLEVRVEESTIFLQQKLPTFCQEVVKEDVANALSIPLASLGDLPTEVVSTGLPDIIVPIKNLTTLLRLEPDFEQVKAISKKYDTIGIHAFCQETLNPQSTAHCRNFAPLYGIPEESATGTANAALLSYLHKHKKLKKSDTSFVIEQGYCMNKPSEITVTLQELNGHIHTVYVGGSAFSVGEKAVMIN